jgi:N-acyl-D-aspartate/D-glutamate deacylase
MTPQHDLIIRGGEVFDGRGLPSFEGDVAIRDGKISAIGKVTGCGREEIDARGRIVTPGFVDVHTHYDGQATWSSSLAPSSLHGTTTVVMGNCSVGFAPAHSHDHDRLIDLMEGVEDIPEVAMHEGLKWNWTSFPEYLDVIAQIPHDIDLCAQVPHAALRLFVMGQRALDHDPATPAEIAQMRRLVTEAVRAGAIGASTSRTENHRAASGPAIASLRAAEDELFGIMMGIKDAGRGVFEAVSDWEGERKEDWAMFRRVVERTGVPLSMNLSQHADKPDWWRQLLTNLEQARADGLPMTGQCAIRAIGMILGLEANNHSFAFYPAYREIANLPLARKVAVMRDPEFKRTLLSQGPSLSGNGAEENRARYHDRFHAIFLMHDEPDYEPSPEQSLRAMAQRTGKDPMEIMYDHLLTDDGRGLLYQPIINYMSGDLRVCREQLASTATVPGIGDGGAHVGIICDASNTTYMLTHWGRDRREGRFDLSWLVKRHTQDTARVVGLSDRGVLTPGMKADLNVIDFANLRVEKPRVQYDLPAGGRRLMQGAHGYDATIVSGVVIHRNDRPTGALPGRLVRDTKAHSTQPSSQAVGMA